MKNLTTRYFCRKFCACNKGTRFALRYKTMRECYDALLAGAAGGKSTEWAIWIITRDDVMTDRDLRLFAVRCARRVQHLMKDSRSIAALNVAERYAKGEATIEELNTARIAAGAVKGSAGAAAEAAAWDAGAAVGAAARDARAAAEAAAGDAEDAAGAAGKAEREAQLRLLAEFGNPFEEEEK